MAFRHAFNFCFSTKSKSAVRAGFCVDNAVGPASSGVAACGAGFVLSESSGEIRRDACIQGSVLAPKNINSIHAGLFEGKFFVDASKKIVRFELDELYRSGCAGDADNVMFLEGKHVLSVGREDDVDRISCIRH